MLKKLVALTAILLCLNNSVLAESKFPDYAEIFSGADKFENYNRKMFAFNLAVNKYAVKPIHVIWTSILPQYGIDRIHSAYTNIEYPQRLVSCLIQKDFKASGTETVRFLTNTTIGLGGLFDPADKFFHIKAVDETMEQAIASANIKQGPHLIIPILAPSNPRNITGRLMDTALNPTSYIATPLLAIIKAGLTVNRTSLMQPTIKMIESNYADPYDITKKLFGIQTQIKNKNLDRKEILDTTIQHINQHTEQDEMVMQSNQELDVSNFSAEEIPTATELLQGGTEIDNIVHKSYNIENAALLADVVLFDYNSQSPVIDAMRTALFDIPNIKKSIWAETSIWNRSFIKCIKTSSVNIVPEKDDYRFKYILQKDKTAPLAIIYPSIGEGATSYHSAVFAKIFYDAGYSVVIQGSHFQWEFVKSMPDGYKPGIPSQDVDYLKTVTDKIINKLQAKYEIHPKEKLVFGTSFGAMTALFLADKEYRNNTLGNTRFIAVCPPVELLYAMKQVDKNTEKLQTDTEDFKNNTIITAAKILDLYQSEDKITTLPFSEYEGKLITGFVMHQKLSDLIFTIENNSKCKNCNDFYKSINNMNYTDYAQKYFPQLFSSNDFNNSTSLYSIADYLEHNDNYKIYHSLDDYLTNTKQLKKLKKYSGKKTVLFSNGSHLGFLYRSEFIDSLKKDITDTPTYH